MSWWIWLLIGLAAAIVLGVILFLIFRPKGRVEELYDVPTAELLDEYRARQLVPVQEVVDVNAIVPLYRPARV